MRHLRASTPLSVALCGPYLSPGKLAEGNALVASRKGVNVRLPVAGGAEVRLVLLAPHDRRLRAERTSGCHPCCRWRINLRLGRTYVRESRQPSGNVSANHMRKSPISSTCVKTDAISSESAKPQRDGRAGRGITSSVYMSWRSTAPPPARAQFPSRHLNACTKLKASGSSQLSCGGDSPS